MSRRNLELILLCVAAPIVILLFAMLALNAGERLGLTTLGVPIGLFAAFIAAHIATRFLAPDADPAILPIVFEESKLYKIVEVALDFFEKNAKPGERFRSMLDRIGWEGFRKELEAVS